MGKPTGFLEYQRATGSERPARERIKDYLEFVIAPPAEELRKQGGRCMDCGIPFCHSTGCPVYNLIPEWNDSVYRGDWHEALLRLEATNNFPEFTGRVCPAPCETACTLAINSPPVTIKQIELAIIEEGFRRGWIVPHPPVEESGKSVAIVGSGPAGLAAAQQLRRAGHQVTVYESSAKIGGLLRYGIPDYKLEKRIIDRRLEQMKAEGVRFETNVFIGEDLSLKYLKRTYNAILLAMGAGEPRDLQVEGRKMECIHFAMEFLTQSNQYVSGERKEFPEINAKGKTVLVIGGGDTGADCVGTSIRQGAKKVHQFEIMPKPPAWDKPWNPVWPDWPNILRTASSHEEGCERDWSVLTKSFSGRNNRVDSVHCARVEWIKGDNGRMQMAEIPGSEFSIKADLVLLATGFLHVRHNALIKELGVELDSRGNVSCDNNHQTNETGIFVTGDAAKGASLVVRAIYDGRESAAAIDRYLKRK